MGTSLESKEAVDRIGMPKYGVEFVSPWHDRTTMLDFAQSWDKSLFYSYEVRRSEFDHVLLQNAAAKTARVIEGCRISNVDFPPEGGVIGSLITAVVGACLLLFIVSLVKRA